MVTWGGKEVRGSGRHRDWNSMYWLLKAFLPQRKTELPIRIIVNLPTMGQDREHSGEQKWAFQVR